MLTWENKVVGNGISFKSKNHVANERLCDVDLKNIH